MKGQLSDTCIEFDSIAAIKKDNRYLKSFAVRVELLWLLWRHEFAKKFP